MSVGCKTSMVGITTCSLPAQLCHLLKNSTRCDEHGSKNGQTYIERDKTWADFSALNVGVRVVSSKDYLQVKNSTQTTFRLSAIISLEQQQHSGRTTN